MAIKYILFHADFDGNESSTLDIEDEEHLTKHYGEWGNYHLIKIGDYE